jgi:hypothetical protein
LILGFLKLMLPVVAAMKTRVLVAAPSNMTSLGIGFELDNLLILINHIDHFSLEGTDYLFIRIRLHRVKLSLSPFDSSNSS